MELTFPRTFLLLIACVEKCTFGSYLSPIEPLPVGRYKCILDDATCLSTEYISIPTTDTAPKTCTSKSSSNISPFVMASPHKYCSRKSYLPRHDLTVSRIISFQKFHPLVQSSNGRRPAQLFLRTVSANL